MPGEFYIRGRKQQVDLAAVIAELTLLEVIGYAIKARTDHLLGEEPVSGSTVDDWQTAESDVLTLGAAGTKYKLHSLLLSIHNLTGANIAVRLYMKVRGVERKVYEQTFNTAVDPPGLWLVNGTLAIHEALRVTLQSSEPGDNGQAVDYEFLLEAM